MNEIAPDDKELVKDRMRRLLDKTDFQDILTDLASLNILHSGAHERVGLEITISRQISRVVEALLK